MFTIIISEKGGAERREAFDKNEINVGRVQGNDLMLPKGNVSKHHARLLFRDGRFIVTDLKSTNGTYVNGRKISQATIVREGDKIYIGDFVLRLETAGQAAVGGEGATYLPGDDSQGSTPARLAPMLRDGPTPAPLPATAGPAPPSPIAAPPPVPAMTVAIGGASAMAAAVPAGAASMATPLPRALSGDSVSHFPLERDPDDSQSALEARGAPKVPPPPRMPQADLRLRSGLAPIPRAAPSAAPVAPIARPAASSGRPLPRQTSQQAARRLALITLVDRVADVADLAALKVSPVVSEALTQEIDRAVRDQAKAMREEGEVPEGSDLELLARDALRELVGLGPLGAILEDDETLEIHVTRPDYVLTIKNGQSTLADPSFTSEDALARVVARLAHQSGEPQREGEHVIERRLARGVQMVAVAPPESASWVLTLRKRRRVETSLEDLVRAATLSRTVATFLEACLAARANVLVVGAGAGAVSTTLAALASAISAGERVAVLQDAEEIVVAHAHVIPLSMGDHGARGEQAVRAACSLGVDRLVVVSLAGSVAAAIVDAIGEGAEGVLAGLGAPSLRHGLARLAAQVALTRPGASIEAAREVAGESFDVVVEVVRAADGRFRVLRVAELAGSESKGIATRDLFVSSADGTGDGAYTATGTVPRFASEFAARGVKLDPNLFKRR